jgi:hypothetical protein
MESEKINQFQKYLFEDHAEMDQQTFLKNAMAISYYDLKTIFNDTK